MTLLEAPSLFLNVKMHCLNYQNQMVANPIQPLLFVGVFEQPVQPIDADLLCLLHPQAFSLKETLTYFIAKKRKHVFYLLNLLQLIPVNGNLCIQRLLCVKKHLQFNHQSLTVFLFSECTINILRTLTFFTYFFDLVFTFGQCWLIRPLIILNLVVQFFGLTLKQRVLKMQTYFCKIH